MTTALEHCINRQVLRFIVSDDGAVFMEETINAGYERVTTDAAPYLELAVGMSYGDRPRMADHLVPAQLKTKWRLGVHRERDYSVWTAYSQQFPALTVDDHGELWIQPWGRDANAESCE